jgi:predicted secreted protein
MSISMAIFTFINAWWIMLFFILPFMTRPAAQHTRMEYAAAPQPIRWRKLFVIDTVLSLAVTGILALIINSGVFPVDTLT